MRLLSGTAPTNLSRPVISGTAQDGQTLTTTDGSWAGDPPITYTYHWRRCAGTTCTPITGATNPTYTLTHDDAGWSIRVVVTATNSGGSTAISSAPTAVVSAAPPASVAAPAISGTATDGQTLNTTDGSWSGTPPLALAYQWLRCSTSGDSCNPITGAITSTYTLTPADVGSTVLAQVTATNAVGSQSAQSDPSAVVAPAPPRSTTAPAISGTATEGQMLTTTDGSWSGTPPLAFSYQWLRCSTAGDSCDPIVGAVASTYTLTPADVGSTVRAQVTATNAAGSQSARSDASPVVTPPPPAVVTAPAVSGTPNDGKTLTTTAGTWSGTGPLSYAYQWLRCDTSGANCAAVSGATSSSYDLTPADVGSTMRAQVTASNAGGSASSTSAATAVVAAVAPSIITLPVVSGTPQDGQALTTTNGTWSGTPPLTYFYQWRRCDSSGNNCVSIVGATKATYGLTPTDVGATIRARVTAKNSAGSAYRSSLPTAVITAAPPANTAAPAISGATREGQTLTTTNGTWTGTPPLAYAYQWTRCDSAGANCNPIDGATASAYTLASNDAGSTIRAQVSASDALGTATATSAPTAPIAAASTPCGTASSPPSGGWQHVVWIVFENKGYGDVIGSPNAPYINSVADECGLATNFTAEAHPSLPNYIAMTSGDTQGIIDDKGPSTHPLDMPNIFNQLGPTGWKGLEESMPANCALSDSGNYVARHNPAVYYTNARGDCATQDSPLGATPDLSARFTFVTPDLCHDMHTSPCASDTASEVAAGDAWLGQFLPQVFASPQYQSGSTAVFITWDEDDSTTGPQHIPTIVASRSTSAGSTSSTPYDHYSLLRTTEDLLGLGTLLGKSKTATSMGPAFNLPPNPITDLGYRGRGFKKAPIPTADKPQSKLWFQDGTWWGFLYNPAVDATQIYRLDLPTQTWVSTGTTIDTRLTARGDVLWDGQAQKLYVVSGTTVISEWGQPPDPASVAAGSAQLSRFSYDASTRTYSLDPGFPATVHNGSTESITLAKDSTGELWVTYTQVAPDNSNQVYVAHSVGSDDVWSAPIPLPTPAASVNYDDISSIIAFQGNKIGVMWSNQDDRKFYFAVHNDGDPDTSWQTEVAYGGGVAGCAAGCANDHISLKADNGLIYAGVKTANKNDGQPFIVLLVRDLAGNWTSNVFGTVEQLHTRPLVLIDDEHRELYLFAVEPEVGGSIYYKATSLDNISFAPGEGTLFMKSGGDTDISNPTSTKQNLNSTTGLVVLASANANGHYWHNYLSLDGAVPATP